MVWSIFMNLKSEGLGENLLSDLNGANCRVCWHVKSAAWGECRRSGKVGERGNDGLVGSTGRAMVCDLRRIAEGR